MSRIDLEEMEDMFGCNDTNPRSGRRRKEPRAAAKTAEGAAEAEAFSLDAAEPCFVSFAALALISGPPFLLKPGKEAAVYRCPGGPAAGCAQVAVKVYKDPDERSFKAMRGYMVGHLRDEGVNRRDAAHLMSSSRGMQGLWVELEHNALSTLSRAGLPVPKPLARSGKALAMEFIGEEDACPRLCETKMEKGDAVRFRRELLAIIEEMLALQVIHGDLSAFNILVRSGAPVIIDFPQSVNPMFNSDGLAYLERDIDKVLAHFERRYGLPPLNAAAHARALWQRHGKNALRRG